MSAATRERSPERETFYGDLITTAIEGGIGYWSEVEHYQWVDTDGTVRPCVGALVEGKGTCATIVEVDDDGEGGRFTIDTDSIARAFGILRSLTMQVDNRFGETVLCTPEGKRAFVSQPARANLMEAYREPEHADYDADDADLLVQLACFGTVVYG